MNEQIKKHQLKIDFGNDESHTLSIPETLDKYSLPLVMNRFNFILKMMPKDELMDIARQEPKGIRRYKSSFSREKVLELIKIITSELSTSEKEKRIRELGSSYGSVYGKTKKWIEIHNIQPAELGLRYFPEIFNKRYINEARITNNGTTINQKEEEKA